MPKQIKEINPYKYDKFIASLYHFNPQDSYFQANIAVKQKAFDDLNLKGIGKYNGENWSIRPAGHDLTDKGWNIIHIKLKEGQSGWNEHGILIINTKDKQAHFTSYSSGQQSSELNLINKGVLDRYGLVRENIQIISPNINPSKGGHDLSYSTSYVTFFIEKLIDNLENSNELGDFTNLNYKHKERANELHKGLFSNFTNSIWVNSMNRWKYYQSLVQGTEDYKNQINSNQIQEVQEVHQQAKSTEIDIEKENQYLEEYNNLPLGAIIEMETYAGWCPTASHTEIDDKTDKELIKLFRIYAVKIWKGEDCQEEIPKLLGKVQNDSGRNYIRDVVPRRIKLWRDKREVEGFIDWKWRLRNVEPFYEEVKKNNAALKNQLELMNKTLNQAEESDEKKTSTEIWKERYEELKKSHDKLEADLLFREVINSPSQGKDKNTSEMANELSGSNQKLEEQKAEKSRLENEIIDKENKRKNLENEGKTDSEEYNKLLAEIEGLKKRLVSADLEIEKLRRQTANLKEQLNANYQTLQEEIEKRKEELKKTQEGCLRKMEENPSLSGIMKKVLGDSDYSEKLNKLLQAQEEITRNNSKFAADEKNKTIKAIPEFSEQLKALCVLKEQLTQLEMKKEDIEKAGQVLKIVMIAPVIPPQLSNKKNDLEDICDNVKETFDYDKVLSESREFILQKSCKLEKLPTRLYSIKENKIKKTENKSNIDDYAILSYVWGEPGELPEKDKKELDNLWSSIGYKNELNPSGYKSLKKAIQTCKLLGIDYLWMDQLCTNQGDNEDKNQEVPKMRQYYFNSAVTLIAIHRNLNDEEVSKGVESEKVLEKVIRSKWFSRSWTFQEGWLSKQTIFMFDSHLIDGSLLANRWVLGQPSYAGSASYKSVLDKGSQKIATPLGWVHYKEGYNEEDKISFTLNQALRAIKNRGRGASIDGIYSILGLLPYGDKVKVEYKKWGERYEKKDLEKALFNVMLTAMKESGYNEYFAWHGLGSDWLPEVYDEGDYNLKRTAGGTSIEGGMSIVHKEFEKLNPHSDIEITASKYVIRESEEFGREEEKDKGSVIDSGACTGNILINSASDNSQKMEEIKLLGTSDLFEKKMKEGDILLLLNKKEWKSNKPFALIIRKKENDDFYQRIGLAEISEEDLEKLQKVGKKEKLTIKIDESNTSVKITDHSEQQLETNIEIPSK